MPAFARLTGTPVLGSLLARIKITDPEVNRKRVVANLVAHPERLPEAVLQHDIDAMSFPGAGRQGFELMRAMSTLRGLVAERISSLVR